MRRPLIILLVLAISQMAASTIWAEGKPFSLIDQLQNQVNQQGTAITALQNQVNAIQPTILDMKGCWKSEFVMTQTGGGSQGGNAPPFYTNAGSKRIGFQYLWINDQSGMKFTGSLFNRTGSGPYGTDWFAYPLEGYINGNLITYYSYVSQATSPTGLEEQRTFNGLINSSEEIWGSAITARNLNSNSDPSYQSCNPSTNFCSPAPGSDFEKKMYIWTVAPFTAKFTKTSNDTCSTLPLPSPPLTGISSCLPICGF